MLRLLAQSLSSITIERVGFTECVRTVQQTSYDHGVTFLHGTILDDRYLIGPRHVS